MKPQLISHVVPPMTCKQVLRSFTLNILNQTFGAHAVFGDDENGVLKFCFFAFPVGLVLLLTFKRERKSKSFGNGTLLLHFIFLMWD